VLTMLYCLFPVSLTVFPSLTHGWKSDLVFCIPNLVAVMGIASARASPESIVFSTCGLCLLRVMFLSAYPSVHLSLLWGSIYAVTSCCKYQLTAHTDLPVMVHTFALWEIAISTALSLCAVAVRRSLWKEVRQGIVGGRLQGQGTALTELLHLICDVVIELDAVLCITGTELKFGALLLLGPGTEIQGMKLTSFMPSEDERRMLEEQLMGHEIGEAETTQRRCQPGLLHVKLRDSLGNRVAVELFYVQCWRFGRKSYMVGLREFSDAPLAELRSFRMPGPRRRQRRSRSAEGGAQDSPTIIGNATEDAGVDPSPEDNMLLQLSMSESSGSHTEQTGEENTFDQSMVPSVTLDDADSIGLPPGFDTTSNRAKRFSLRNSMSKWCLPIGGPVWCCPFHAAVMDARKTLNSLQHDECIMEFGIENSKQCDRCGIVEPRQAKLCSICESDEFTPNIMAL